MRPIVGCQKRILRSSLTVTQAGSLIGSPAYMSPEQISTDGDVDRRTDVWGLGVSLFEVLTQRLPFTGPSHEALYHAILTREPDSPRRLNPRIPKDLEVVGRDSIPVLTYGLRTDFQGELFEGSRHLLAWADELNEIKTICHCGSKATMVVRTDEQGRPIRSGSQIEIGGNERYVSLCRAHFKESLRPANGERAPAQDIAPGPGPDPGPSAGKPGRTAMPDHLTEESTGEK